MASMDAVRMEGVVVERDGCRLLDGVCWRVRRGERWAVLGLNGSGKTTLVRMIAGFAHPSAGTLRVLGREFGRTDLRELRRSVGWVAGDGAQEVPWAQTALETVVSGGRGSLAVYDDPSEAETSAARSALSLLGAGNLAARRLSTLSSGERQTIWIARCLMADPELLVLDEPCLALDPVARERFLSSLSRLLRARPDVTALMVTHHVEEIPEEFGHVLLVGRGRIAAQGTKGDVLSSRVLSGVFGPGFQVRAAEGRYSLGLAAGGAGT